MTTEGWQALPEPQQGRQGVGEDTHPFASLLLTSDIMSLMPISQNQLENRGQMSPKNPAYRGQPPEAQSRTGKGGDESGERGKQKN